MNHDHPHRLLHSQEFGLGPAPLVCLHSSGASGGQWRALAERLQGRHRLVCVDLPGHGRSSDWAPDTRPDLALEAEVVWMSLGPTPVPLDLVGHSYGAALALQMARQRPERVRSLTLYEPVLFGLLKHQEPWGEAWHEIADLAGRIDARLARHQPEGAAALFCDYWADGPAWAALNCLQQQSLARRMPTIARHFQALFAASWGTRELARLPPLRLLCGGRTRAPARRISELLALALPQARLDWLPMAGHLGPISHPDEVAAWLSATPRPAQQRAYAQACV
ncbi:alpha/beta hydrolase [Roseateles sp. DAIF2]|uniref:alpha/beta fold hydrolase n=1 Tax=Roseateles sp. DAIF2 TaxID=2714952 RepID=UPI0018A2B053|nr:alpha/beta hydrolase [Roseateles sp. DAIF2]QPF71531.1 alpha/beta hydrolase [Roseateles sp. DAIF2]